MSTRTAVAYNRRKRIRGIPFSFLLTIATIICLQCMSINYLHVEARADLYKTLNVPKSASSKDITKAYRKLALKHHPDKVSASEREEAEKKFKEIGYAHDILTDDDKRKRYDMYGEKGLDDNFMPGFSNMGGSGGGNSFGGFGGGGSPFGGQSFSSQQYGGRGGPDLGIDLNDILQQFLRGQQPGGRGRGMGGMNGYNGMGGMGFGGMDDMANGAGGYHPFGTSRGGHTRQQRQMKPQTKDFYCTLAELSDFNGCIKKLKVSLPTGDIDPMTGEEELVEKIYTISVQPGWKDGTKVRFKASKDGTFPPITFVLRERKHKYILRDGDDLVYRCTVTTRQAEKGARLKIPLPDGEILELETKPDEIHESYVKKFHGKGMPVRSGSKTTYQRLRGDFRIEFRIRDASQSKSHY